MCGGRARMMGMERQELYRTAKREIERRRQRAESEAMARRQAMRLAEPRLAELEGLQSQAGASAARCAAAGQKEEATRALEEAKRWGGEKQALLEKLAVTMGSPLPEYSCRLCGDTGLDSHGKACSCVHEEMKRMRREEIISVGPLRLCRFENFRVDKYPEKMEGMSLSPRTVMQGIYQDCVDWAREFGPFSQSLFMFGDAGLGKTHLALSIAAEVLEGGWDVIYVSAQQAFSMVSAQRYEDSALFDSMLEADLLVLDDLGTEYLDAFVRSKLYELVNARMGQRPTIYTTNICKQEMLNMRYDEKITSRLLGQCHLMRFWGEDIRLMK